MCVCVDGAFQPCNQGMSHNPVCASLALALLPLLLPLSSRSAKFPTSFLLSVFLFRFSGSAWLLLPFQPEPVRSPPPPPLSFHPRSLSARGRFLRSIMFGFF